MCNQQFCWFKNQIFIFSSWNVVFLVFPIHAIFQLVGKINDIKIIMAIDKVDEGFTNLFKDFKKEMSNKEIICELRVIIDTKTRNLIHDRFLISKYDSYNIPSPDIIARGQLSEISKSQNKAKLNEEFSNLWKDSKDIVNEWDTIKEQMKK